MTIFPEYQNFKKQHDNGKAQIIWKILPADLDTPVSVALKLQHEKYLGLYESVEGGKARARYSFITLDPDLVWVCNKNTVKIKYPDSGAEETLTNDREEIFTSLRRIIKESQLEIPTNLPPMSAGIFGYMGYNMVRYMEVLPDNNPDEIGVPESVFIRPRIVIIFDSVKDEMIIVTPIYDTNIAANDAYQSAQERIETLINKLATRQIDKSLCVLQTDMRDPSNKNNDLFPEMNINIESNTSREEYCQMVKQAKEYILAGDIFQVVLAQRFNVDFECHPLSLYRHLRRLNPSPYSFYMQMEDFTLVGSSPEILVRVDNKKVTIRPIAGTRPRGENTEEDLKLEKDLLSDEKELSEHLMLIDLGRNDIGRVAQIGSVKVNEKMIIEHYSHVMHIVSNVEGILHKDCDAVDAVIASFPVGTVSGAPKIRAMEIIDELEKARRSFYAGGVGYFSANGGVDMCIALRTGLVKDNKLYIQAGGGVVSGSTPEGEYMESCNKARALVRAAQMVIK